MKIIGITGGIGVGKSAVLSILKDRYDAYIIEADKVAHKLMLPGEKAYNEIVASFGEDILNESDKTIDRSLLRRLVLSDEDNLYKLNGITHPLVKEYILNDIETERNNGTSFYIIEAALLIQDGYKNICDEMWTVVTDRNIRIKRLMEQRGLDDSTVKAFLDNQPEDSYYIENSDRVIHNDGSKEDLIKAIDDLILV